MGGNESKHRSKHREIDEAIKCFDSVEMEEWRKRFGEMSQGSPTKKKHVGFSEEHLSSYTKPIITGRLQKNLMAVFAKISSMLSGGHDSSNMVEWEPFIVAISHLIKSGLDERAEVLTVLCGSKDGNVTKEQLAETLKSLFHAYVAAESKSDEFQTWQFSSPTMAEEQGNALASFLVSDLNVDYHGRASVDTVGRWMGLHSVLAKVIDMVIYVAFHFEAKRDPDEITSIPWTIPSCETVDWGKFKTLLTIPTLLLINYNLPSEYRRQWKLLYSTSFYGESFSTLLKQITMKGPTVMIIRDENGHVFGGFNSKSWELSSSFLGDDRCFLFSLLPTVGIYPATGYNRNYCYLNTSQQTLPNGLGFGGTVAVNDQPVHYFALWLDHDFGIGSSQATSTTYNNPRLSSTPNFKIHSIEVWAVERHTDVKKTKLAKSILDIDPEAQAMLEMAGKSRKSEGLRERPPPDEDDSP